MVPNYKIFHTTNDDLREAAVEKKRNKKEEEKRKVICPFVMWGANKIFLYNIVILYYY